MRVAVRVLDGISYMTKNMRRKDREMIDKNEIRAIVDKCDVCRLGLVDDGLPYIVPMNFGCEWQDDALVLYFHCANEGRKLDILRKNPQVCFQMDCGYELVQGKTACSYSFRYQCIIGYGKCEFVADDTQKRYAIRKLMAKYTATEAHNIDKPMIDSVTILKVVSADYSAKRQR